MAVASKISPFYEPGAPPPPVPLLTSQVEFCYEPTHAITITAQEELPPGPATATHQKLPKAQFWSPVPSVASAIAGVFATFTNKIAKIMKILEDIDKAKSQGVFCQH